MRRGQQGTSAPREGCATRGEGGVGGADDSDGLGWRVCARRAGGARDRPRLSLSSEIVLKVLKVMGDSFICVKRVERREGVSRFFIVKF